MIVFFLFLSFAFCCMVLSVVSAFNSFGLGVLVWGLVVKGGDGDGDPFLFFFFCFISFSSRLVGCARTGFIDLVGSRDNLSLKLGSGIGGGFSFYFGVEVVEVVEGGVDKLISEMMWMTEKNEGREEEKEEKGERKEREELEE